MEGKSEALTEKCMTVKRNRLAAAARGAAENKGGAPVGGSPAGPRTLMRWCLHGSERQVAQMAERARGGQRCAGRLRASQHKQRAVVARRVGP